ncbi:MAG: hypothetical protein ACOX30_08985 [Dethiobacteria bacterium]|jgi:hypothetical protein
MLLLADKHKFLGSNHLLVRSKKTTLLFGEYLAYTDSHRKRSYKHKDARKIVSFHQLNHLDDFNNAIMESEKALTQSEISGGTPFYYSKNILSLLERRRNNIKEHYATLTKKCASIEKDIKILKKYVWFWPRIKIAARVENACKSKLLGKHL